MFCKKCGKELQEDAKFCTNCGAMVEELSQDANSENIKQGQDNSAGSTAQVVGEQPEANDFCELVPQKPKKKRGKKLLVITLLVIAVIAAFLWKFVFVQETPDSKMVGKWTVFAVQEKDGALVLASELTPSEKLISDSFYFEFYENHTGKAFLFGVEARSLTWKYIKTDQDAAMDIYRIVIETDSGTKTALGTLDITKGEVTSGLLIIASDDGALVFKKNNSTTASAASPKVGTSRSAASISTTTGKSATSGEKNALKKAKEYLNYSAFSYTGLIEQLEYEDYSNSEATYAAKNCGADWNEQAERKAKEYLDYSSFSKAGLIEQLEYEGFTHEQAVYGVDKAY